jgi:hypothetical protein
VASNTSRWAPAKRRITLNSERVAYRIAGERPVLISLV